MTSNEDLMAQWLGARLSLLVEQAPIMYYAKPEQKIEERAGYRRARGEAEKELKDRYAEAQRSLRQT